MLASLVLDGADIRVTQFQVPHKYGMALETSSNDEPVYVEYGRFVTMTTKLHIRHGSTLTLCNVTWLVAVQPTSEPLLCRALLAALGLNAREALGAACNRLDGYLDVMDIPPEAEFSTSSTARLISTGLFLATATLKEEKAYKSDTVRWLDCGENTIEETQVAFRK